MVLVDGNNNNSQDVEKMNLVKAPQIALALHTETETYPFNLSNNKYYVMASLKAGTVEVEPEKQKAPLSVITVLDISGSMSGERMNLLKETMKLLIEELRPIDSLGIVTFGSNATTLLKLTIMDDAGKQKANERVNYIKTQGSTFLSAGLQNGMELLPADCGTALDRISTVLLLTDGIANVGISTANGIGQMIDKYIETTGAKFTIYTFGYCQGHNASFLKDIAAHTEGTYYYIESVDQIRDSFADCMGGLMSILGQQVQLTLTATPGHKITKILTKFKVEELEQFKKFRITFGDIQSEESRDIPIVMEVMAMDGTVPESPVPMFSANLEYYNVISESLESFSSILSLRRVAAGETTSEVKNHAILKNVFRVEAARIMQEATLLADKHQFEAGRNLMSSLLVEIKSSPVCEDPEMILVVTALEDSINKMKDHNIYKQAGSYEINQFSNCFAMQRNNNVVYNPLVQQNCPSVSYESTNRKYVKAKWAAKK